MGYCVLAGSWWKKQKFLGVRDEIVDVGVSGNVIPWRNEVEKAKRLVQRVLRHAKSEGSIYLRFSASTKAEWEDGCMYTRTMNKN